jgi:tRNA(His) 5'-end guanylyltransferase
MYPEDETSNSCKETKIIEDVDIEEKCKREGLGDRMKKFEKEEYISHKNAIVIRLDGKNFSSFTKAFKKPFDVRFTRAMIKTMNDMIKFFHNTTGFCCSDEITLIISPTSEESGHDFKGRVHKMNSLYAGKCSAYFLLNILNEIKDTSDSERIESRIRNSPPCFDSRLMEFKTEEFGEIVNNLYWRSRYDCYRNCVSSVGRYKLGQKGTFGLNGPKMIAKMKETKDYDFHSEVNMVLKYGVYGKSFSVEFENDKGEKYIRHHIKNFTMVIVNSEKVVDLIMKKKCIVIDKDIIESTELKMLDTETYNYAF